MEKSVELTSFKDASTVRPLSSHEYQVRIHEDWSYGPAAHGGFLTSLIWKTIRTHFHTTLSKYNQLDIVSLHVEFLRLAGPGEATISIKDTRLGRRSSTIHAVLVQGGRERVAVYATCVNRSLSTGINLTPVLEIEPLVPPIDFNAALRQEDPNWISMRIPPKDSSTNKILGHINFVYERQACADKSITQLWLNVFDEGTDWTMNMLGVACDQYVPPLENYYNSRMNSQGFADEAIRAAEQGKQIEHYEWKEPRWYTTANMTLDVKRNLSDEGVAWLFCRYKTTEIVDGRCDVHGQIWDQHGNLIALAQYLWLVDEFEKATAARTSKI